MNIIELQSEFKDHKTQLTAVSKLVNEIARLEKTRSQKLPDIKARIKKLEVLIDSFMKKAELTTSLNEWIADYKMELSNSEVLLKKSFGADLAENLAQQELTLTGQYPNLKAGLFTIEVDLDAYLTKIWYGPKQELLEQCGLSAVDIGLRLGKAREHLGSHLADTDFLKKLHLACLRAAGNRLNERIPIISVLSEFAHLLQNPKFYQDPRRENYRSYSRADFSYDLFRTRKTIKTVIDGRCVNLVGAVRQYTRRRQDFLWVPSKMDGDGSTYSHLQLKEGNL